MYHSVNEYELLSSEHVSLNREDKKFKYEAFILGDYVVSFKLSHLRGGICGELCLIGGGTPAYILDIDGREVYTKKNRQHVTTLDGSDISFSVVYSVGRRRFDIYVNGELKVKDYCADSGIPVNCDKLVTLSLTLRSSEEESEVVISDLKAHSTAAKVAGSVVYDASNDYYKREKKIVLTDKTYIPKDDGERSRLLGCAAIHMRSGVMYRDGEKRMCAHMPTERDGEHMVAVDSLSFLMNMSDGDLDALIEGNSIKTVSVDGVRYASLEQIAGNVGLCVFSDTTAVHSGAVILHDGSLATDFDKESLQRLNDFIFYFRPSKERLLCDYSASSLRGVHPRVLATEDDFERIRKEIKTNAHKKKWFESLIRFADSLKDKEPVRYELRDGVRLIYVAWDLQLYAMTLALAYKLTGDRKYFEYAWRHLLASAEMPDWNPSHHIDVGILAFGYSVAYDWFYDVMTEEERRILERGAYENLFYTLNLAFEDPHTAYTTVLMQNNHNVFSNAGVMATVIAFMDVYPEIAAQIGSNVIRILECFMDKFAPEGAYYEGPYYAQTAIDYTVRLFASMESALGTLYGLDRAQGFDRCGEYMMLLQSDVAAFNFADSHCKLICSSGLFWIFDHFGVKGLKESLASQNFANPPIEAIPQAILWYDVSDERRDTDAPTVVHYPDEEIITMRSSYDRGQTFVGIKAGKTLYAHSHLDAGSFIFDAMGKRWAYDFGQDDYNLYYKYNLWDVFRLRAESHNTLLVNPNKTPGYVLGSHADVTEFLVGQRDVKTVVNMTDLYGADRGVQTARRGFLFTDSRMSLVIRDELTLTRPSELMWLMYTDAEIEIDGTVAVLTDKTDSSKKISVEFVSPHSLDIGFEPARPLPTSPDVPGQNRNDGFQRLYCRFAADGDAVITAKVTCCDSDGTSISLYDKNMDSWFVI